MNFRFCFLLCLFLFPHIWGEEPDSEVETKQESVEVKKVEETTEVKEDEVKEEKEEPEEKKEEEKKEEEKKERKEAEDDKGDETELENYHRTKVLANWHGWRDVLRARGMTFSSQLVLDDIWNLCGGIKPTPWYGAPQFTFSVVMMLDTEKLWCHRGGTFYIAFLTHHGKLPSVENIGSFNFVNDYEARNIDTLYALWYRQYFGDHLWVLVGKNDAYEIFTKVSLVLPFFNSGYASLPTILFFPTYPEPAMGIVAGLDYDPLFFILGIYDGSLALGRRYGAGEVFGHFFNDLCEHAFVIAEVDWHWCICHLLTGKVGLGIWKDTAPIEQFNGGRKKGTEGFYVTLEQILYTRKYPCFTKNLGMWAIFSAADPTISPAHYYLSLGFSWEGFMYRRPFDLFGVAMSRIDFTSVKEAEFFKGSETAYELLYSWQLRPGLFLRGDFQYVVHPGGRDLPNASVIQLRLFVDF